VGGFEGSYLYPPPLWEGKDLLLISPLPLGGGSERGKGILNLAFPLQFAKQIV